MRGQLSAEMLILIVVVLAVLAIVASQLLRTAEEGSERIEEESQDIFEQASEQSKAMEGDYCNEDEDCESGLCSSNRCL